MSFDSLAKKWFYPEKIDWKTRILQHHKNTDGLMVILNIIYIPFRIKNKVLKVYKKIMSMTKKTCI